MNDAHAVELDSFPMGAAASTITARRLLHPRGAGVHGALR